MDELSETDEGEAAERYGALEMETGDLIIYDRENPQAWLQAGKTVDIAA